MKADADKLTNAKTLEITKNVYAIYKPEIEAARMRYMAAQSTIPPTVQPVEPPATQPTQQPALASPASTPTEPPSPTPTYTNQGGVIGPKIFTSRTDIREITWQQKINGTVTCPRRCAGKTEISHVVHSIADTVDSKHRDAALTLDQAAIDTVRKYKFTPAMLDGRPVAVYLNVAVNFQIN